MLAAGREGAGATAVFLWGGRAAVTHQEQAAQRSEASNVIVSQHLVPYSSKKKRSTFSESFSRCSSNTLPCALRPYQVYAKTRMRTSACAHELANNGRYQIFPIRGSGAPGALAINRGCWDGPKMPASRRQHLLYRSTNCSSSTNCK